MWMALIGSRKTYRIIDLGECVAYFLFELEPQDLALYVVMSKIYAMKDKWDVVANVTNMMKDKEVKKETRYN